MTASKMVDLIIAAFFGAFLMILLVGWSSSTSNKRIVRECEVMGITIINDKPYRCTPLEAER